jgi:general secretion pathway protein D
MIMMHLRILLIPMVFLFVSSPAYSDEAKAAFNRGARAQSQNQYDAAYEAYKEAFALRPKEPKYEMAYLRSRALAAEQHVQNGQSLRDQGKLQEALGEFQKAAEIDHANHIAEQEVRRTAGMIRKETQQAGSAPSTKSESPLAKMAQEAEGPVDLEPASDTPLTLRMTTTADNIYKTIGKLAGFNILFDLDYKPQRITVELNDVSLREALKMVALESKTFWRPIATNAIFVAAESKRKEFEGNVMKTFYVRNASTPAELQEVVGTLKGILDINRVQVSPNQNAVTLRGTNDQMVLAEKLLSDLDKPKSEVVVDIAVMEISRSRLRTLGTVPPTSGSISWIPPASGFTVQNLGKLNSGMFSVSIPGATATAVMSDGRGKILQNPEIRVLDNEKATLKIGDRIPIATGSFQPGVGGGGINPLVNTQFQYIDVGVNIDITPHVHSEREVTLKMVLEVSSVTGTSNLGGIDQPTIGQRRIEHETRLQDGDVNLVGGILEDTETTSLGGYPWLAKMPILKFLFGQEKKERQQNEIVFAITPHIVRATEVTDENLRMIDIGTASTISVRHPEAKKKAGPSPSPSTNPARGSTGQQGTQISRAPQS